MILHESADESAFVRGMHVALFLSTFVYVVLDTMVLE